MTAVTSDSAILQLPDSMEVKIPVNSDHSQIVKFDNNNDDTYQMALRYLKLFEEDAGRIIPGRFCMWTFISTLNVVSTCALPKDFTIQSLLS
jgi:protein SERAC1